MSEVSLSEKYQVSESLEELKNICEKNGSPTSPFAHSWPQKRETTLEEDLRPWIKDYQDLKPYKQIKAFQRALVEAERKQHERGIERVKVLLRKIPVIDKARQGASLREEGMSVNDICKVLEVSKSWFENHCRAKIGHITPRKAVDIETIIIEMEERIKRREVERGRYGV